MEIIPSRSRVSDESQYDSKILLRCSASSLQRQHSPELLGSQIEHGRDLSAPSQLCIIPRVICHYSPKALLVLLLILFIDYFPIVISFQLADYKREIVYSIVISYA